uniref:Uncharacterized protein n=1 Tax=Anguilla anguilla TaxID=7936 RepID=A0A0E9VEE6_ANGAN
MCNSPSKSESPKILHFMQMCELLNYYYYLNPLFCTG